MVLLQKPHNQTFKITQAMSCEYVELGLSINDLLKGGKYDSKSN